MTGTFTPVDSSNTLWFDENMTDCLTYHIEGIEDDVAALETGKANVIHEHSFYADIDHEHSEYALTTHTHSGYAATNHTHTDYAASAHSHSEYALATDVDALETKVGDSTVAAQISAAIATKADSNHTHTEYAPADHTHSGYASTSHTHSEYANVDHTHTGYASSTHVHSYNDLEDKPTIPTTLPANGGNADTVDGKHANEFATATDLAALQTLVGDTAVSAQIATAVASKANTNHTHTASDVGALPYIDARSADYNMDTILASGVHYRTYRFNNTTLGTPYAKGASAFASGLIVSCAASTSTGKQIAYVNGAKCNYERRMYNGVIGDWESVYNSGYLPSLSTLGAAAAEHTHNVFSSLEEIGITTFPTTMQAVSEAMPLNSMIVIDTRRVNGTGTTYGTETISDWGNTANGTAVIIKGASTARIGMMILYGTTATTTARIYYGSYAHDNNNVNWCNLDDQLDAKVNKISAKGSVDLNTVTETGLYYVTSGGSSDKHFPTGTNGHLLVMSDGTRVRQVFFRVGTVDTNNYQWYSRSLGSDTTAGVDGNGWSQWWLLSGYEKIWNGGTVLNSEINIGSRYGCTSWVVVARLQNTGALASVVIPRAFLVSDTTTYRFQIADETAYISFYIYYKSDNDVYLKVVDQTDSTYTTLKYVYRMS